MRRRTLLISAATISAGIVAPALQPRKTYTDVVGQPPKLDTLIPSQFHDWTVDEQFTGIVSPDLQAAIESTYSQSLNRTYKNHAKDSIMLALGYGDTQTRVAQVHKPEVCYAAQGFKITDAHTDSISFNGFQIPVMRLIGAKAGRIEPVTYWIRSGEKIVRGWAEQNIARIYAGLHGYIPDGLLFRTSELSDDPVKSYAKQDKFIVDLLAAIPNNLRWAVLGSYAKNPAE